MRTALTRSPVARALAVALLGLSMACSGAKTAAAEDHGPTPATAHVYQRLLDRFDANHDGLVQTSELPALVQERLAAADANHDGVITTEELLSYGVTRRAARFATADENRDGKLEPSEVGAVRWEYIKVADADGDGAVTLDEIERAVAAGTLHGLSVEEVFQLFDRNHDGIIDLTRVPVRERTLLTPADANHDAKVTLDELKAYRVAVGRD